MRFLAVTDFHGQYEKVADILHKAGNVDGTLVAGDLTEFGPAEKAKVLIDMLPRPILAVPGNCDPREVVRVLEGEDVCLHLERIRFEGVTYVGIGGSNPTPFGTPFELSEDEIRGDIEGLMKDVKGPAVLLSHAPPKGFQDRIPNGVHVGSEAIAESGPNFKAIVCGHIHEDMGISKMGDTLVVNPGVASEGNAAIVEIDEKGNASATLIKG
jgi:Icc-related predicted phosphoesterase